MMALFLALFSGREGGPLRGVDPYGKSSKLLAFFLALFFTRSLVFFFFAITLRSSHMEDPPICRNVVSFS